MNTSLPLIALVGLPNAGKSTLLNKIAGRHFAITSDVPGTTRDRQYIDSAWNGAVFTMVDTAGLTLAQLTDLEQNVDQHIEIALQEADAIVWVVDGKQPVSAVPQILKQKFRKLGKPVLLFVNKLDSPKTRQEKMEDFKKNNYF